MVSYISLSSRDSITFEILKNTPFCRPITLTAQNKCSYFTKSNLQRTCTLVLAVLEGTAYCYHVVAAHQAVAVTTFPTVTISQQTDSARCY